VDTLGNHTRFRLTAGQAYALHGTDVLLPQIRASAVIADRSFDADKSVLELFETSRKQAVIPPRVNRKEQSPYDKKLYNARHLIGNFFAKTQTLPCHRHPIRKTFRNFLADIHPRCLSTWLI
jgi:transposase